LRTRVAYPQATEKKTTWPIPPPTSVRRKKRARKTLGPFRRSRKKKDRTTMARLTRMAAIPVAKELGIRVRASSVPRTVDRGPDCTGVLN